MNRPCVLSVAVAMVCAGGWAVTALQVDSQQDWIRKEPERKERTIEAVRVAVAPEWAFLWLKAYCGPKKDLEVCMKEAEEYSRKYAKEKFEELHRGI